MALHLDYHYTDEDISDEQIDQLLKRAEVRLREQANSQDRPNQSISLPRTSRSELPAPYVQTRDQIAQVDPKRLLSENDRWLANSVKKVEDPLEVKRKKYEVGSPASLHSNLMTKLYSNSFSSGALGSVMDAFLQHESSKS